ncbi:MAG: zf-HC2 domain-containing protein [Opitutae bacterium]|nr:zf-HC2 domain-containing protein [Opitutae bacterium]
MNCRETEALLLAERDGVLTTTQHAELARHVAACPACRQLRADLAEAAAALRADVSGVRVPDAGQEWRVLQGKLPATAGSSAKRRRLAPVIWFGAPLAAAAALAFAYFGLRTEPRHAEFVAPLADTARADFVEVADAKASTMVYVDKDSGWLVVWAVDGPS